MITFIEQGNRIATENFEIGEIYTITFTNGNYKTMCCIGVGSDFVMFQYKLPNALFCLTLGTAETVSTIEIGGGGSGTMNYNELENKPQINGVVLIGNKSAADLNLASTTDLNGKQDILTDTQLTAVNSGITSSLVTQIGTNTTAISGKQDQLSVAQLTAVNSGITSSLVSQITTNQNNILIEDVTSHFTAKVGYTLNTSYTKIYKQGTHIFGKMVVGKDSGTFSNNTQEQIVETDYKMSSQYFSCAFADDLFRCNNIGYCFAGISGNKGVFTVRDTVLSANNYVVLSIDYIAQ